MNNDLIKRSDVEQMLTALGGCDASDKEAEGWDKAIDAALYGLGKVESADKWILIKDDKPPLGRALMVTVKIICVAEKWNCGTLSHTWRDITKRDIAFT